MAVTEEQKTNPFFLGDTGCFDRVCKEPTKPSLWFKAKKKLGLLPKCESCGTEYPRLPTKQESRFDCSKPGCYWMIFSDGSQTHDYPGE